MNVKHLSISDFSYELPEERIASHPRKERDASKLLVLKDGAMTESVFKRLPDHLPENSLVIFNDTRVVEARIIFHKPTGAKIEIFCLEPDNHYPDITTALGTQESVLWKCLVGNASSWTTGLILEKQISPGHVLRAQMTGKFNDHFLIRFSWSPQQFSFAEILHEAGLIPLPPYIKRKAEKADTERYQTVYADHDGSVAAPTAGLHFTENVLKQLTQKNISKDFVTLHVGAGTFKPVKSETMEGHEMHAEFIEIKRSLIERIKTNIEYPLVAVGTTSLRTLESIYWIGNKIANDPNIQSQNLHIKQWDPYENSYAPVPVKIALEAVIHWMDKNHSDILITKTALLIAPSYSFRLVDILITNFHQPHSTLLLLVAAFIGEKWKSVYNYALQNDFRFLSYGDSCLFFRQ